MFFIVGVQRSGTTLLRLLLDSHSQVAIPFESMFLVSFAKRLSSDFNSLATHPDIEKLAKDLLQSKGIRRWEPRVEFAEMDLTNVNTYGQLVEQLYETYARKCGKSIWGDKTPTYESDMHLLYYHFPEARFINLIRDGRDVALSLLRQPWGPNTLVTAMQHWKALVSCSRKMGYMLPAKQYLEVFYENLVANPQHELKRITEFLGIPFEQGMLEKFNSNLSRKLPHSSLKFHQNLNKTIDPKLSYKWRTLMSRVDQTIAHEIAGDLLRDLQYPLSEYSISGKLVFFRKLYLDVQSAFSWRYSKVKSHLFSNSREL